MTYTFLQEYWWLLISVLGALLVMLLFVQGGQSMIFCMKEEHREKMVYTIAHRWELTFTVLVTFGGAFFASFPLFYSTSFGGAYWLWMLILFSFIIQAVSYKYRLSEGNLLGRRTYDAFLTINGIVGPVLLGVAVAGFFFGNDFNVSMGNIVDNQSVVISQWGTLHGLEAIADWRCLAFGVMVLFLTRVQANLWFISQVDDADITAWNKRQLFVNAAIFVVLFLAVVALLLISQGYETIGEHQFQLVDNKYFHNLFGCIIILVFFLVGTVLVLAAIALTLLNKTTRGIWLSGLGTVMVVLALFWLAGYGNTPYYPSVQDPSSSLTIYNSSSSEFTLKVMLIVSLAIPFVAAYIAWVWYKLTKK